MIGYKIIMVLYIVIRSNKNNLNTLFHVVSNKDFNLHYPHCPVGPDSWCKYNQDRANGTNNCKPGPGLPISIVLKPRPILFEELSN